MPLYSRDTYKRTLSARNSVLGLCDLTFMYEPTDPYSLYLFLRYQGTSGAVVTQLWLTDREQFADVMMTDGAISDHHGKVIVSNAHEYGFVCVELRRGGTGRVLTLDYDDVWDMLNDTWERVPEGDEHDAMSGVWDKTLEKLLQGGE